MDDAKLIASIVALVAIFRKTFPKVDGPFRVLVLAMGLGAGLWWLHSLDVAGSVVAHGLIAGISAVGGMVLVDRHAEQVSNGTAKLVAASLPPPPLKEG